MRDDDSDVEGHSDTDRTKMLTETQAVIQHHCGFCGTDVSVLVTSLLICSGGRMSSFGTIRAQGL